MISVTELSPSLNVSICRCNAFAKSAVLTVMYTERICYSRLRKKNNLNFLSEKGLFYSEKHVTIRLVKSKQPVQIFK